MYPLCMYTCIHSKGNASTGNANTGNASNASAGNASIGNVSNASVAITATAAHLDLLSPPWRIRRIYKNKPVDPAARFVLR